MTQHASKFGIILNANSGVPRSDYIVGIDSLRGIAALTVMFDHLGYVPSDLFKNHHGYIYAFTRLILNCFFNGPAAVIIFFVVSGFFIHLPQTRKSREFHIGRFYTRRFLRIGIPAFVVIIAFKVFGSFKLTDVNSTVLWSVVCEVIYYFLYPALLPLGQRLGWAKVAAAAYVISFGLCITHLGELRAMGNAYIALGWWTWLVGLPCWIVGCWLAENRKKFKSATRLKMWSIRISILALAIVLRIIKFHIHFVGASNCFTLNFFALPVAIWIGVELASSAKLGHSRLLEWTGKWSYSIYLIHPISTALLALAGIVELKDSEPYILLRLAASLVIAYCFFLVIEKPSHRLAIRLSRQTHLLSTPIP